MENAVGLKDFLFKKNLVGIMMYRVDRVPVYITMMNAYNLFLKKSTNG